MSFLEIYLLIYFFFYYGILLGLRSYILFKKTGINPFKMIGGNDLTGFNEKVLSLATILIPVIIINYVFIPGNYPYLVPIHYLEHDVLQFIGIAFSSIGFLMAFIAQIQMHNSWRIGIDRDQETELIHKGLFRYSRNPIYLGLMISFLGFFLILPSAVNLCFLVLMYTSLQVKIRIEESHLIKQNGEEYTRYFNKVRRWI